MNVMAGDPTAILAHEVNLWKYSMLDGAELLYHSKLHMQSILHYER